MALEYLDIHSEPEKSEHRYVITSMRQLVTQHRDRLAMVVLKNGWYRRKLTSLHLAHHKLKQRLREDGPGIESTTSEGDSSNNVRTISFGPCIGQTDEESWSITDELLWREEEEDNNVGTDSIMDQPCCSQRYLGSSSNSFNEMIAYEIQKQANETELMMVTHQLETVKIELDRAVRQVQSSDNEIKSLKEEIKAGNEKYATMELERELTEADLESTREELKQYRRTHKPTGSGSKACEVLLRNTNVSKDIDAKEPQEAFELHEVTSILSPRLCETPEEETFCTLLSHNSIMNDGNEDDPHHEATLSLLRPSQISKSNHREERGKLRIQAPKLFCPYTGRRKVTHDEKNTPGEEDHEYTLENLQNVAGETTSRPLRKSAENDGETTSPLSSLSSSSSSISEKGNVDGTGESHRKGLAIFKTKTRLPFSRKSQLWRNVSGFGKVYFDEERTQLLKEGIEAGLRNDSIGETLSKNLDEKNAALMQTEVRKLRAKLKTSNASVESLQSGLGSLKLYYDGVITSLQNVLVEVTDEKRKMEGDIINSLTKLEYENHVVVEDLESQLDSKSKQIAELRAQLSQRKEGRHIIKVGMIEDGSSSFDSDSHSSFSVDQPLSYIGETNTE
jgi:peptidoglycan hydrolase CwlO-like protein